MITIANQLATGQAAPVLMLVPSEAFVKKDMAEMLARQGIVTLPLEPLLAPGEGGYFVAREGMAARLAEAEQWLGSRRGTEEMVKDLRQDLAAVRREVRHARDRTAEPETEGEAKRVFAMLMKLKSKRAGIKAPLHDVFVLTVLEGLAQREAAKRCQCSLGHLAMRVREMEEVFGMPLERLKAYARPLLDMETSVKGDRRRKGKPGSRPGAFSDDATEDDGPEEEDRYEETPHDD